VDSIIQSAAAQMDAQKQKKGNAIDAELEALLSEHLGDIADPLSRSMFLAGLSDKAMTGDMPIADFIRQALKLAETEENIIVLEQIAVSLVGAVDMMQRLRPETETELSLLLGEIEQFTLAQAQSAQTPDLQQLWLNTFLDVVASEDGLLSVMALLNGETIVDGIEISPELRWKLLIVLSRQDAEGIDDLLAAEIERDPSDFGQRSLLSARAAKPTLANKEQWVDELQSPEILTSLAKQRAVIAELFPATQTDLQLKVLPKLLSSLPEMSREADAYFLTSYTRDLFTPMCQLESSALMQTALDEFQGQLNPTVLRFLREAHQADVECQLLRVKVNH